MSQDTSQTITSSAKRFFSGTMISRISGLGREMAMAAAFGTLPTVAAFWMAFRFAHLLRRLFGEGGMHVAFIPHFESLRKEDPKRAALFFHRLSMSLMGTLLVLVLFLEGILGVALWFGNLQESSIQVIRLTMLLLPSVIFICLYALNQSLLNCEKSFFIPSVAPTILNLIWIGAVIWLWNTLPERAMENLAMVIVFAFAAQWFITVPKVYSYLSMEAGARFWESKIPFKRDLFKLLRPFLLGLIGVAATQINNALDAIFARIADPEGPALLWYALRIQQLPLALLGIGLTGALLPPISRAIQANDREKYLHFLRFALKKTCAFMIPITVGVFVLGFSGVNLVYGRGEFSSQAAFETTLCLWAYGAGLLPMTLVLILASAFYARKNYRIPTLFSVFSVLLNVGLNAFFVFGLKNGPISIAMATSISALVNVLLLTLALSQGKEFPFRGLLTPFLKILLCSLLAGGITLLLGYYLNIDSTLHWMIQGAFPPLTRQFLSQIFEFGALTGIFTFFLFTLAFLFRIPEISSVIPFKIKKIA